MKILQFAAGTFVSAVIDAMQTWHLKAAQWPTPPTPTHVGSFCVDKKEGKKVTA